MNTKKLQKLAIVVLVSTGLALTGLSAMAAPSKCPSIQSLKSHVSTKGLKVYGDRYVFRQYGKYDTGQEWELVVTNRKGTNLKVAMNEFKTMSSLKGHPNPDEKMGKGTWFCEYTLNDHKVVANYPALCSKDVCSR